MYCQYFCNYNSVDRKRGLVEVVFDDVTEEVALPKFKPVS